MITKDVLAEVEKARKAMESDEPGATITQQALVAAGIPEEG